MITALATALLVSAALLALEYRARRNIRASFVTSADFAKVIRDQQKRAARELSFSEKALVGRARFEARTR
jgi:hypothetical protein